MTSYRLAIDEIKDSEAITTYTRWVDAVQLKRGENEEVYLTFSPRFEHIWLESKRCLLQYVAQKPANIGLRSQYAYAFTIGRKSTPRSEAHTLHWSNFARCSGWIRQGTPAAKLSGKHV